MRRDAVTTGSWATSILNFSMAGIFDRSIVPGSLFVYQIPPLFSSLLSLFSGEDWLIRLFAFQPGWASSNRSTIGLSKLLCNFLHPDSTSNGSGYNFKRKLNKVISSFLSSVDMLLWLSSVKVLTSDMWRCSLLHLPVNCLLYLEI